MPSRRPARPARPSTRRPRRLVAILGALVTGALLVPGPTFAAASTPAAEHQVQQVRAAAGHAAQAKSRKPAAKVTTKRGRHAVRWATQRSYYPTRRCIVFVRSALQVAGRYGTPRIAWAAAHHRHRTAYRRIPAGVPVFTAGRTAPGHVVLSLGNGRVRSTDWPRNGRVGTVKLSRLLRSWNHHYLGWSEDLNGVRVWHR